MIVAYDENGYSFDVNTGYYVTLYWDEDANAYDAATGEPVDEILVDSSGTKYTTRGGGVDWEQLAYIAAQAYAAGQGAAQSGRYIPNPNQSPYGYQTLNQPPQRPPVGGGAGVGVGVTPGGVSGGINLSTNTLMLGGLLLAFFVLGQKRGK